MLFSVEFRIRHHRDSYRYENSCEEIKKVEIEADTPEIAENAGREAVEKNLEATSCIMSCLAVNDKSAQLFPFIAHVSYTHYNEFEEFVGDDSFQFQIFASDANSARKRAEKQKMMHLGPDDYPHETAVIQITE